MDQKTLVLILILFFVFGLAIGLISAGITGNLVAQTESGNWIYVGETWSPALTGEYGANSITIIEINPNSVYPGEYLNITIEL